MKSSTILAIFAGVILVGGTLPRDLNGADDRRPATVVHPSTVGMDPQRLQAIRPIVESGIDDGRMAGAVVLIGHQGHVVYRQAFGHRQLEPEREQMTVDTVFDLASLTKPIATATSVMILVERGDIRLRDSAENYLPDFGQNGKDDITVTQLLTHQGGLIPDNALRDYLDGPEKAIERIMALGTQAEPGTKFIYTDVGFIVLAEIVRQVSGRSIDQFSREEIFEPLGMRNTGYLPGPDLQSRSAATEQREGRWMKGEVHDPRAYAMGGVAGHAGLFSTADDLAIYAQMMLNQGSINGRRVLSPQTIAKMTEAHPVSRGTRGLGWDKLSPYSSNRGELMSDAAFGHGGFTGTSIWIDPELDLYVIFLSTRLHPDGRGSVNSIAGRIGTIAAAAVGSGGQLAHEDGSSSLREGPARPSEQTVLAGIDVLQQEDFATLQGERVGLITNHTGLSLDGTPTYRLLHESPQFDLVALFSPEHGFEGQLDIARIDDGENRDTGLPIYSLYGETRRPTGDMLKDIDTLVFDIQDIGTRFYTYISTMGEAMQAAAEHQVRFVVLDRPNPINGLDVQGPVLDDGQQSFVGFHPIPIRHGMTVGELALMMREELDLDLNLEVIRCRHWSRDMMFDRIGRTWVNPSPNMRSLTQALLYPGVGLLETTNVSVGRGTDTPFEIVGAPWIEGRRWSAELNRQGLPGIRFVPIQFTPDASKFQNELCGGVQLVITDRRRFDPLRTGWTLATSLRALYPADWQVARYGRLLGDEAVLENVRDGNSVAEIMEVYRGELSEFKRRREPFLLYR